MIEYEIAKVNANIRTSEEKLKTIQEEEEYSRTDDSDDVNHACMMDMLERDFEKELHMREEKLRKNMEKKKRMNIGRIEKHTRDMMIQIKEHGHVVRSMFVE